MGAFGIGTWELLLILVVALIIWGPGRLPEIARMLGRMARTLKRASNDFTSAFMEDGKDKGAPTDGAVSEGKPAQESLTDSPTPPQDDSRQGPEKR